METKIIEGADGEFVVHAQKTFKTMGEAQSFISTFHGGEKVDRRKTRPRAFDEFCEYLPNSSSTYRRAKCNICVQLHGHIAGVTESTFHLEWTVSEAYQDESRERENNEASRHMRAKVKTGEGFKTVQELHQIYKADPAKYAVPAPPPPHEPVMASYDDASTSEMNIEDGEDLAGEVARLAHATAYAVIAMQEPVSEAGCMSVDLEKCAKAVLAKNGVHLLSAGYESSKYNMSKMEEYLCKLPRSESVDLAIEVIQKQWYYGVKNVKKNMDYLPRVLACFKAARSAHQKVMAAADAAFAGARIHPPWQQKDHTSRILAALEDE